MVVIANKVRLHTSLRFCWRSTRQLSWSSREIRRSGKRWLARSSPPSPSALWRHPSLSLSISLLLSYLRLCFCLFVRSLSGDNVSMTKEDNDEKREHRRRRQPRWQVADRPTTVSQVKSLVIRLSSSPLFFSFCVWLRRAGEWESE